MNDACRMCYVERNVCMNSVKRVFDIYMFAQIVLVSIANIKRGVEKVESYCSMCFYV